MLVGRAPDIPSSDITDKKLYLGRRAFIQAAAMTAAGVGAGIVNPVRAGAQSWPRVKIQASIRDSGWGSGETPNSYGDITTYNNFYEFGPDTEDPAAHAHRLTTRPWTVRVDGLVARPADYHLEDLVKPHALEERISPSFRTCVRSA
jgi:sulfoxide reductase catalytic subunit YedY